MVRRYDLLEMIASPKECWKIHVRVIRLWSLPRFKDPKSISSIQMVLMDEQGTTMYTSVGKDLISVFESLISEGAVYVFTYFGVSNNYVAGVMTGVKDERKYVKDGKLIDMLVIHIENDGLKLNITVLGEMVDRIKGLVAAGGITSEIIENNNNNSGTNILQNIMYSTRLLINPDVPEAVMLRKSAYYREISQYLSVLSGKLVYVNEDEVLYSTERKTIKELQATADVGFYVVLATVLNVEPVLSWWYKSCVCSVKAEANTDTYFCYDCNKDVYNVVDRYDSNWTYLCNLFIKKQYSYVIDYVFF
ncbi:hypothetical protein Ahy_B04g069584 [Arachis hypogaea]|uniref:Replication protein A 70 kDa DNA-binding subunit B/D first OB fold domain-containing protein n=1 Tax=Arachis hypogaea TaxID=3818 RepID=A0A444ZD03_ARAHY|nr:hypothetical protein Ahy_B04g069584 [Arachis hypogaea]